MSLSVLIVDDIFINRMLLREILKNICTECYEAENGKDAIELLNRKNIDIVLMDIEMPVMNGIETTIHIREKFIYPRKNIPIIALTAHDVNVIFNNKTFEEVGFNKLLTKPYSQGSILNIIKEFVKK